MHPEILGVITGEETLEKAGFPARAGLTEDTQVTLHCGSLIFYQCKNSLGKKTKRNKNLFSAWLRVEAQ